MGLGSREDFALPSLWSTEVQSTGSSDAVVCYQQEPRASKRMTDVTDGWYVVVILHQKVKPNNHGVELFYFGQESMDSSSWLFCIKK